MPTVRIPSPLRHLADGAAEVQADGTDVRSVLDNLDVLAPGIRERVVRPDGSLHAFVHVFVGDLDVRAGDGLDTQVQADDIVTLVPAVAGGSASVSSRHPRADGRADGPDRRATG